MTALALPHRRHPRQRRVSDSMVHPAGIPWPAASPNWQGDCKCNSCITRAFLVESGREMRSKCETRISARVLPESNARFAQGSRPMRAPRKAMRRRAFHGLCAPPPPDMRSERRGWMSGPATVRSPFGEALTYRP